MAMIEIFVKLAVPFLVGASAGGLFAALKLPIPAPSTIAGVLGIIGIFAGFMLITMMQGGKIL